MYTIHTTTNITDSAIIRKYIQDDNGLNSSITKAWESVKISVSRMENNDHISLEMIRAQEKSLKKVWDTPENDVWDKLYKELNA